MNINLLQISSTEVVTMIVAIAFSIAIFLLVRGIMLWYWRIDEILKNQEKQIQQQQTIIEGLAGLYMSMNNTNDSRN